MRLLCWLGIHRPYVAIGWTTYECQKCPAQWVGPALPEDQGVRLFPRGLTGIYEAEWSRPGDPERLRCTEPLTIFIPRMKAVIRQSGCVVIHKFRTSS